MDSQIFIERMGLWGAGGWGPSLHSLFIGTASRILWLHHIWKLWRAGEGLNAQCFKGIICGREEERKMPCFLSLGRMVFYASTSQNTNKVFYPQRPNFTTDPTRSVSVYLLSPNCHYLPPAPQFLCHQMTENPKTIFFA